MATAKPMQSLTQTSKPANSDISPVERLHALVPAVFVYWTYQYNSWNTDVKNYRPAPFIAYDWNSWEWEI